MRVAGTLPFTAVILAFLASTLTVRAAETDVDRLGSWQLTGYSEPKSGSFEGCGMRAIGTDQVWLVLNLNTAGTWRLWLYRADWQMPVGSRFGATLDLDQDRNEPVNLQAKLRNAHYVALQWAPQEHLLASFATAATARISRDSSAYTFPINGYAKAVTWVRACVARNLDAASQLPDGKVRGADSDEAAGGVSSGKPKPGVPSKVPAKLAPGIIEVQADESDLDERPAENEAIAPKPASRPAPGPTAVTPVPNSPPTLDPPLPVKPSPVVAEAPIPTAPILSEAAKATASPIPPEPAARPVDALLPRLMAAADRADFRLIDPVAAPLALKHAEVVFAFAGATGAVMALDVPTADAAVNEIVAHDRIACAGAYQASSAIGDDVQPDVLRSAAECLTGDKRVRMHFLTMARKSGGFYVIGLSTTTAAAGEGPSDQLAAADLVLFGAALKVSGQL